jgi:hypothetical protein
LPAPLGPAYPVAIDARKKAAASRINLLILLSLDALPCSIAKRERAAVEKGFFGHDGMMLHPIKFPTRNSDALTAKIPVLAEFGRSKADIGHSCYLLWRDAIDPYLPLPRQFCCDAQDGIATTI